MEIPAEKLIEYFSEKSKTHVKTGKSINKKYQQFTKESADSSRNLFVIEFRLGSNEFRKHWTVKGVNLLEKSAKLEELRVFLQFYDTTKIQKYLDEIGVSIDEYCYAYDYTSLRSFYSNKGEEITNVYGIRTYLVFFSNLTYNLIRLTYKEPLNDNELVLSFEPRIGYEEDGTELV